MVPSHASTKAMPRQIHLGPRKSTLFATVDDEDYDRLMSMGKWHARKKKRTYYAENTTGGVSVKMHQVVMGKAPDGMVIDHEDGDGLNNQKNNLRLATFSQNASHRIRKRAGCTSEYRGVRETANGRWTSRLKANGVRKSLGTFETEVEAALAYDEAGIRELGEFFKPNFPDGVYVASGFVQEYAPVSETFDTNPRSMAEGKLQEGSHMAQGFMWGFR